MHDSYASEVTLRFSSSEQVKSYCQTGIKKIESALMGCPVLFEFASWNGGNVLELDLGFVLSKLDVL